MKLELDPIGSLANETTAIQVLNSNFDRIVEIVQTLLSRDGETPNFMSASLDMNSNRVLNLPSPGTGTEPARLIDIQEGFELDTAFIPAFDLTKPLLSNNGGAYVWAAPADIDGLGDLVSTNNLSDIANSATARTNLGLGTAATATVGTSGDTVPVLSATNTWSGAQTFTGGASFTGSNAVTHNVTPIVLDQYAVGWRGIPLTTQDTAYGFVLADAGRAIIHTSGTGHAYTIPNNTDVAYPLGTHLTVVNVGAGAITLTRGSGVDLRKAGVGTNANLSVAQWGVATLYKYATNSWIALGPLIT